MFSAGKCPVNTFMCDNGECVTKLNPECDLIPDCVDGSDEAYCCMYHNIILNGLFSAVFSIEIY